MLLPKESHLKIGIIMMRFKFRKNSEDNQTETRCILYDLFFNTQYLESLGCHCNVQDLLSNKNRLVHALNAETPSLQNLIYLSESITNLTNVSTIDRISINDILFEWGHMCRGTKIIEKLFYLSTLHRMPIYLIEDGFLKSVCTGADIEADNEFKTGVSFTIDDLAYYFDGTKQTRLEQMLNSDEKPTDNDLNRAKVVINVIRKRYLSKYNHQPIFIPEVLKYGKRKVLVVDQTYGDFSIIKGKASEETFHRMLHDAINNNKDAQIIIKIHPDTIAQGKPSGYFSIEDADNAVLLAENVNPLAILEQVDVVYVCTSQMGFEALMCNKEVHVYGMPFYAGWGLTKDQSNVTRRNKTRSLEELFYYAYIKYSSYVNPQTKSPCEIETAIDLLTEQRDHFFKKYNIFYDKVLIN
jgi:capsular polysaccharide export protein